MKLVMRVFGCEVQTKAVPGRFWVSSTGWYVISCRKFTDPGIAFQTSAQSKL